MQETQLHFHYDDSIPNTVPDEDKLHALAIQILNDENMAEGELNVIFTDDESVRELNKEWRKLDKTTDVLSFVWDDDDEILGEVYISVPQVERQAPKYGNDFYMEMERVIVHGILHICGYDHIVASERKIMRNKEESYLSRKIY